MRKQTSRSGPHGPSENWTQSLSAWSVISLGAGAWVDRLIREGAGLVESASEVIAALASGDLQLGNIGSSPLAAATSRKLPIVAFIVSAQINAAEAELMRAVADILDCPMPPLLAVQG